MVELDLLRIGGAEVVARALFLKAWNVGALGEETAVDVLQILERLLPRMNRRIAEPGRHGAIVPSGELLAQPGISPLLLPAIKAFPLQRQASLNTNRHGRPCVLKMHVPLVFAAKHRGRVFDSNAIDQLHTTLAKVCDDFEAPLFERDGEDDHVHLQVEYPPKVAVSDLVNSLKGMSNRLLRKERPDTQKRYWNGAL